MYVFARACPPKMKQVIKNSQYLFPFFLNEQNSQVQRVDEWGQEVHLHWRVGIISDTFSHASTEMLGPTNLIWKRKMNSEN